MKHFYFTDRKSNKCAVDRTISVYGITNGKLVYITETEHRPGGGSRGAQSEAFQTLLKCGAIPEKYRGDGYFAGNGTDVTLHYSIDEIY